MRNRIHKFHYALLLSSLLFLSTSARPFVLVISPDDLQDPSTLPSDDSDDPSISDWDEFGDSEANSDADLDPGSWRPIFEPDPITDSSTDEAELVYYSGVRKMMSAVSEANPRLMEEAAAEIEAAASSGNAHAQSALGFLYGTGVTKERNRAKAFTYHYFSSNGGNMQSKMALAYTYYRQNVRCFLSLHYFFVLFSVYVPTHVALGLWIVDSLCVFVGGGRYI